MHNQYKVIFNHVITGETKECTFTLLEYIEASLWLSEENNIRRTVTELGGIIENALPESTTRQAAYCAVQAWKNTLSTHE